MPLRRLRERLPPSRRQERSSSFLKCMSVCLCICIIAWTSSISSLRRIVVSIIPYSQTNNNVSSDQKITSSSPAPHDDTRNTKLTIDELKHIFNEIVEKGERYDVNFIQPYSTFVLLQLSLSLSQPCAILSALSSSLANINSQKSSSIIGTWDVMIFNLWLHIFEPFCIAGHGRKGEVERSSLMSVPIQEMTQFQ